MYETISTHRVKSVQITRGYLHEAKCHTLSVLVREGEDVWRNLTMDIYGDDLTQPVPIAFDCEDNLSTGFQAELERYREIRQRIVAFRKQCEEGEYMDTGDADDLLRAIQEITP